MKIDLPMRNINPFGLRLQPELKAKLEEAALQNKRSLNAEISARLESTFPATGARSASIDHADIVDKFVGIDSHVVEDLRDKIWQVIAESIAEAMPQKPAIPAPKTQTRTKKLHPPSTWSEEGQQTVRDAFDAAQPKRSSTPRKKADD